MSKEVRITIVTGTEENIIYHKQGGKLLNTLISRGGYVLASCGGRGACGQCAVQFLTHAPLPSHADRACFTPKQLREGYRLACMAKPAADCRLRVCFLRRKPMEIALEQGRAMTQAVSESCYIAVDLGTTTIAMQLLDAASGGRLAVYTALNPQSGYGADVISRIEAANSGERARLQQLIHKTLREGVAVMLQQAQKQGVAAPTAFPKHLIISGNTTMEHLFMGYDTASLGTYPFASAAEGWSRTELDGIPTIWIPGVSAFVGGDIVSGIYACGMAEREDVSLLLDLGTNGEMAIGNRNRIVCTAAAAGPAFEGGAASDIFGADMIKITADMLRKEILDETGLLSEPYFETGYESVSQQDIRTLQMAKAAVRAGIQILLQQYGTDTRHISRVYLAGGFGMKLDIADAGRIGLLPEALQNKITVVCNASLQGASQFGMQPEKAAQAVEHILAAAEEINLAEQPEFARMYLSELNFPL